MIKLNLQVVIGVFKYMCSNSGNFFFLFVIIDMKMVGFKNPPVEMCILDFIAAKIKLGITSAINQSY